MTRTLHLRERSRRLVRLDSLDVTYLRTLPRRWLRLERVGRRHLLTIGGIAGTLVAPTCRLAIAPKVPLASLLGLLDQTPPATTPLPDGPIVADALLDVVAGCFLHHLRERLRAGLHHGYREQNLAAPILHGRLDLPTQVRQGLTRPDVLHQVQDAFTPDVPCNRLLRAALNSLITATGLSPETRAGLAVCAGAMTDVTASPIGEWLVPPGAPPEYAAVVDAARLVLAGLTPGGDQGPGVAFVLELERLFERYVLRGLTTAAPPGVTIEPQARRVLRERAGPALVVKPDALVFRAGEAAQVIDAKWKRLRRGRVPRADLYQMLAYAETLAVAEVVLIYPGRSVRSWHYPHTRKGTRVDVWTVSAARRNDCFERILSLDR